MRIAVLRRFVFPFVGLLLASATFAQDKPVHLTPQPIVSYPLQEDSMVKGELRGRLEGPFLFRSKIIEDTVRKYWIYVPAEYKESDPAAVLVFQDGARATNPNGVLRVQNVLDNLIAKKQIPVTIGIFITPGQRGDTFPDSIGTGNPNNRDREYDILDDRYARFIIDEMLPEVGKKYKLSDEPAKRAIGGSSSGAICAFTVAWHRPDQFRNVVSLIGSYTNIHGGHIYPELILKEAKKPIRIFLQDGINDLRSPENLERDWYVQNQKMKASFTEKDYDFAFVLGEGGHSDDHGGAMLPLMLRWIWRDDPSVEKPTEDLVAQAAAIAPKIEDPFQDFDPKGLADSVGSWNWERANRDFLIRYKLTIQRAGNEWKGELAVKQGDGEPAVQPVTDMVLIGNKLTFNVKTRFRDTTMQSTYSAIVKEKQMSGWSMSLVNGTQRDARWSCTRD
jgi:enterochelin esterase family protein